MISDHGIPLFQKYSGCEKHEKKIGFLKIKIFRISNILNYVYAKSNVVID